MRPELKDVTKVMKVKQAATMGILQQRSFTMADAIFPIKAGSSLRTGQQVNCNGETDDPGGPRLPVGEPNPQPDVLGIRAGAHSRPRKVPPPLDWALDVSEFIIIFCICSTLALLLIHRYR
ncbi:hypothetical protein MRX96_023616 [Rhipicephalus microplus]